MKLITVGVDCESCRHCTNITLLQCYCAKRQKQYWIGYQLPCEDKEIIKDECKNQETERTGEDTNERQ